MDLLITALPWLVGRFGGRTALVRWHDNRSHTPVVAAKDVACQVVEALSGSRAGPRRHVHFGDQVRLIAPDLWTFGCQALRAGCGSARESMKCDQAHLNLHDLGREPLQIVLPTC